MAAEKQDLFDLIQKQSWKKVLKSILSGENVAIPDQETGSLPLHAALQYSAPEQLIVALFTVNKAAVKHRDKNQMLPIHIAIRAKYADQIILLLHNEYTDGSLIADKNGEMPLHRAIISGSSSNAILAILLANSSACRQWCSSNKGSLPLHLAFQYSSPIKVVSAVLSSYSEACKLPDGRGVYPINYLLPSCGNPSKNLQDLFAFSKADFYPFLEAWKAPASQPCSVRDVQWMLSQGLIESRHVGQLVSMLLQSPDEGYLSNRLFRIGNCVKEMIEKTENPVRSAIAAAACYAHRATRAVTIKDALEEFQSGLVSIAHRLMQSDAIDSSLNAVSDSTTRLLVAQESPHIGLLHTMFTAGPVADAVDSGQEPFMAEPAVIRLVQKAWWGGDWSFPINSKVNDKIIRTGIMEALQPFNDHDIERLVQEIAQPEHAVSCPAVRFIFERAMDVIFASLLIATVSGRNLSPEFSSTESALAVFMFSAIMFEVGQVMDDGFVSYISDRWNLVDISLYSLYLLYFFQKVGSTDLNGLEQYETMVVSQRLLALCVIVMGFKLLYVSTLQRTLGVLVLMVMKMIQDLGVFLLLFTVIVISFMVTMHNWLGDVEGFFTYSDSLLTLIQAAFGNFDFSPIQQSATWGDRSATYWGGTTLMTIYLLLVLILLINLVIAKMSSTYDEVRTRSYPQWCLMKAAAVADCQAARSFICVLPVPFNWLTIIAYPVVFGVLCLYYLIAHGDAFFSGRKHQIEMDNVGHSDLEDISMTGTGSVRLNVSIGRLATMENPFLSVFGGSLTSYTNSSANRRALIITDYIVKSVYSVCVSFPAAVVTNMSLGFLWGVGKLLNPENGRKRFKDFCWGLFVRSLLYTIISPFYIGRLMWKGNPIVSEDSEKDNFAKLNLVPEYVKQAIRFERNAMEQAMFEIYRQRCQMVPLLKVADEKGFISFELFLAAVVGLKPRINHSLTEDAEEPKEFIDNPLAALNEKRDSVIKAGFRKSKKTEASVQFEEDKTSPRPKSKSRLSSIAATTLPNMVAVVRDDDDDIVDGSDSDDEIGSGYTERMRVRQGLVSVDVPESKGGLEMKSIGANDEEMTPMQASLSDRSLRIKRQRSSLARLSDDTSAFKIIVQIYNVKISKISQELRDSHNIVLYENVEKFLRKIFKYLIMTQNRESSSLHVGDFLANLSPFLPIYQTTFIRSAVHHMDADDAVFSLREEVMQSHVKSLNRLQVIEERLISMESTLFELSERFDGMAERS